MSYIVLAIPIFFILIIIEWLTDFFRKTKYYRFNDALTNLSCGIGSQLSGIFLKVLTFGTYAFVYENYALFKNHIPFNIWTTIVLFVGVDFFYYWFHRLAHEIAVIWGSHVVHHQSEEYNLTVALRQAWLQGVFSWFFYIPLAFVGFDPYMFVTVASFQTLYQFWIHTRYIGKLPAVIEYIFNTPSHHRVHHGINPQYIDKNHGGTLIVFDRIFNTFEKEQEEVVYGITQPVKSWNPIWVNFQYWIELAKEVYTEKLWSYKFKRLFYTPGWHPQSEKKNNKILPSKSVEKYRTEIPVRLNVYIMIQFLIILLGSSFFLFNLKNTNAYQQILASLFIIFSLTNLGGLFELKKWAFYSEITRIGIVIFVLLIHFLLTENNNIYLFGSIILLFPFYLFFRFKVYFVKNNTVKKN